MAKLSDDDMQQLLSEFLIETREGLDAIEEDLVKLEQDPNDRSLLEGIFRTMHTIKGSAGFLDLRVLEGIAHVSEDILTRAMEGKLILTPASVTVLLEAIDTINGVIESLQETGSEGDDDHTALKRRLKVINESGGRKTTVLTKVDVKSAEDDLAGQGESWGLFDDEEGEEEAPAAAAPDSSEDEVADDSAEESDDEHAGPPAAGQQTQERAAKAIAPTKVESTIRIDVNLLEKLMNLVGELVLARNQLLQYSETMDDPNFLTIMHRASLVTSELQENVMKARMQPIGTVFSKFPRIVRDLAMASGKQIELSISGEETELDRTIHEGIRDPLVHLIRNDCDHGVEKPNDRIAKGKTAKGTVHIAAYHEGGHVNIDISDDGNGVNVERVKAKGVEKGVITSSRAQTMSDKEARELIMMPGFSTAEQITNVSGRGVGMDVVKTNVEQIGGTIEIDSEMGRGTTFRIKIPLTLAIIPALVVRAGGERFAIPQINLKELVRIEEEDSDETEDDRRIEKIHGTEVMRLRGRLLPLARLPDLLGLESQPAEEGVQNVVVLNAAGRELGLIVDGVRDVEEIVVKPLSRQLKSLQHFAGSTIMGDGRVALILDVNGLAQAASDQEVDEIADEPDAESLDGMDTGLGEQQTVLLFSVGKCDRFAIPLSLVSRLEEFKSDRLEMLNGRKVVQYRNKILPIVDAEAHYQVTPSDDEDRHETVNVIVFEVEGRNIGVLVNEIVDVVDARVDLTSREATKPGLSGSAIIGDRTTLVMDVFGLFQMEDPSLLRRAGAAKLHVDESPRGHIAVVDDSQFFRALIQGYLTAAGHRVQAFASAEVALDAVLAGPFDLVLSDLDMPGLDGISFVKRLRADESTKNLPVLAVTARPREEFESRAKQAGFNGYLVKLDHRELVDTVSEALTTLAGGSAV